MCHNGLMFKIVFPIILFFVFTNTGFVRAVIVLQGNPVLLNINEIDDVSDVKTVNFNNKPVPIFAYNKKLISLVGIDLNQKPGGYGFVYELQNGDVYARLIRVQARQKPQEEIGIPQKLGGNTEQAQTALVSNLSSENSVLGNLYTGFKNFWSEPFQYPIQNSTITGEYGYIRETGDYFINHKGVDFRAREGTSVKSMNRGVVRLVKDFTVYGKTVVIDHGLGAMSMYMHLSKAIVNQGELVLAGQVIGLSGSTGYAENPHLHLSVRIDNVSVDPIEFLRLFSS